MREMVDMVKCLNKSRNEKNCPCPDTSCEHHGICCECVAYHRSEKNKPMCMR